MTSAPAPTDALKDEREAFEREWAKARGGGMAGLQRDPSGGYAYTQAQVGWWAWQARASASGLSRPGEGDWVLVPREPTSKMLHDGASAFDHPSLFMGGPSENGKRYSQRIYRAMLTATPARSTAPSVLTAEEHEFLLAVGLIIRLHGKPEDADRLLRITRRLAGTSP